MMKLVALCGLQGAGKDTVADELPAQKFAFADVLYREVAKAFGVTVEELKDRTGKEVAQDRYRGIHCRDEDEDFLDFLANRGIVSLTDPRSPRQILQWWGDYRRAQDPDYFIKRCAQNIAEHQCVVITDCRFQNEADMVRKLGGQIWQVVRRNHTVKLTGHKSETAGDEFNPDVILFNDGPISELQNNAIAEWLK